MLQEDSDVSDLRKNIQIDVILIQAKTAAGFSETAMDRFVAATEDLFDLSKPLANLRTVYNESLLDAARRFRDAYQTLASKFPRLKVSYFYATKGDQVHPNVSRKTARVEAIVKQLFSAADFAFTFLGSRAMLDLARRKPTTTYDLKLAENPISSTGEVAFVCLVSLRDFFKFITDTQGVFSTAHIRGERPGLPREDASQRTDSRHSSAPWIGRLLVAEQRYYGSGNTRHTKRENHHSREPGDRQWASDIN